MNAVEYEKKLVSAANEQLDDTRLLISRRDRYFPMEPDGDLSFSGFVQKPAALRAIRHDGRGLFDARDRQVVAMPVPEVRINYLTGTRDARQAEVNKLQDQINRYLEIK